MRFSFQIAFPKVSHQVVEKLVDKENGKVKVDIMPKTNEEYLSVKYGRIRFIDSYRFLIVGLDGLVRTLDINHLEILNKRFLENWNIINKKLAYPHD